MRRVLAMHVRPESDHHRPSWLTFIGHIKDSLWRVDLFRCESLLLTSHWVMVMMDVCTRRLIEFSAAAADIDGVSVYRMFTRAIAGHAPPKHRSSDHDPLFTFHRWRVALRSLEVDEIKTLPQVPSSHPFVERLIGTIRREYLDHVFFWNVDDLTGSSIDSEPITTRIPVAPRDSGAGVRRTATNPRCTRSICMAPAVSGTLSYPDGCLTRNSPLTGPETHRLSHRLLLLRLKPRTCATQTTPQEFLPDAEGNLIF
ncbi:MAG: DDE-type integrase/transposase/recombinase [Nitrospira sp.]|nr:DDE-type integrase/transposase/recombinase [Nitrospira sp.]